MMDALDLKISRRLQRFLARVEKLAQKEFGEPVGLCLCVHPTVLSADQVRIAEFQYISNLPRSHMHEAFRALVKKWDAGGGEIPPHVRN
jgi:hypothetical protein